MAASVDADNTVVMSYLDDDESVEELTWTTSWTVRGDADDMLEQSELVKIMIDGLVARVGILGPAEEFRLEVKPPQGGVPRSSGPHHLPSTASWRLTERSPGAIWPSGTWAEPLGPRGCGRRGVQASVILTS